LVIFVQVIITAENHEDPLIIRDLEPENKIWNWVRVFGSGYKSPV